MGKHVATLGLLLATILYVGTAVGFGWRTDWPMALVYVGYVIANVGFIWYAWITQ